MLELAYTFQLELEAFSYLTGAVQFGFVVGTLTYALLMIADRFSSSKVFFVSAIAGAAMNYCTSFTFNTMSSLIFFRCMTGFFLAGIYPVGMKIAADYYQKGLGKSLGFLVGALVLGTACPHFIKAFIGDLPWRTVIVFTSFLAVIGGSLIFLFVPNGPFQKTNTKPQLSQALTIFKNKGLRKAAIGYFGHMWELYAFWTFVPIMLLDYQNLHKFPGFDVSLLSFSIIAVGGISCVLGGFISKEMGAKKTAIIALFLSCLAGIFSPLFFLQGSQLVFVLFLLFWGATVIPDSPLFSSLVAINADPQLKGTALTLVTCIGFAITIVSIQMITLFRPIFAPEFIFMLLAVGPIVGLYNLLKKN